MVKPSPNSAELTPLERRIVVASVLILMLFSCFFWQPNAREWLFGSWGGEGEVLAKVVQPRNDVRRKGARRFNWMRASEASTLSSGDALFTGVASAATIELRGGRRIDISEQTLIRLVAGADGKIFFRLNGEEIEIPADGAGTSKLSDLHPARREPAAAALAALSYPPVALPTDSIALNWTLEDLYETGENLRRRSAPPAMLPVRQALHWKTLHEGSAEIELAADSDFTGEKILSRGERGVSETERAFVGQNFFRVRTPGGPWSEVESFGVSASFLPEGPRVKVASPFTVSFGEPVVIPLEWTLPAGQTSSIVEVTTGDSFRADQTRVHWVNRNEFALSLPGPGRYRVRVAGLNAARALSVFSPPQLLDVGEPPLLAAPRVPARDLVFELSGRARPRLRWFSPTGTHGRLVTIFDERGQPLGEYAPTADTFDLPLTGDGKYGYQATAVDQWGRRGKPSAVKPFAIRHPAPVLAEKEPASRAPAQSVPPSLSPSLAAQLGPTDKLLPPNAGYSRSSLQVEGASFGMFSTEQVATDQPLPLAATLGLRWMHWWDNLGLEWTYKTKVFNYNEAASGVAPSSFEGKTLYRFTVPWEWFDFLREIQISALVGLEKYSNPSSTMYAKGYDLLKLGTRLEFPLSRRWETGGEVLYGRAGEGSQKYEISGHANYFLNKDWILGLGYRVHALEAASEKLTPRGELPYREAYGEGFTVMRYIY